MAQPASSPSDDHVVLAYAVEIAIPVTAAGSGEIDLPSYGGEIVRDAIAGWGIPVVRIVHLGEPDKIFPSPKD